MTRTCKKLVTDIGRKANLEEKIPEYADLLEKQYNFYAVVKMCMNYYTMKSMLEEEQEDSNTDVSKYFGIVSSLIQKYICGEEVIGEEAIEAISQIRDNIEYKMKNLTSYTDALETYEYILNRVEAGIKGNEKEVNTELLSQKMYSYVFSESDSVVVNSKIKLLMAQLPVRMTKNKFYDVITNTLSIYKGGDRQALDEFVDMLRTSVLIEKPKGFENEYPYLFSTYNRLKTTDYTKLEEKEFDELNDSLTAAANIINGEASAYMLLQEIVNDVYTILLTQKNAREKNIGETGYSAAIEILAESVKDITVDELTDLLMPKFVLLEGVQEDVYESIMILETVFDDVIKEDILENKSETAEKLKTLSMTQKLLSTSLFIDLSKENTDIKPEIADNDYIMQVRETFINELADLFKENNRIVNRSIMSKLLASMPVFFNNKQDIKDYFDYVLENCKNDSELTACEKLIEEIIEE